MNRRGFLARLAGCLAGTALAPYLPTPSYKFVAADGDRLLGFGTWGSIERATYSFWRNQATLGASRPIDEQVFANLFDMCEKGTHTTM